MAKRTRVSTEQTRAKFVEYARKYRSVPANKLKIRARNIVKNEVERGRLTRLACEQCGEAKTHAHHDDYSKPLDVRWLCHPCHGAVHRHENRQVGGRAPKTHCPKGHEYTPDNIYRRGTVRYCRRCTLDRNRRTAIRRKLRESNHD